MPGRPPKPLALHILHGTGRKSRLAKRSTEFFLKAGSIGSCPNWVSPEAKQEWRRLVKSDWGRILTPADRSGFLQYCILHGRQIRAERGMKQWLDGKESEEAIERMGSQEPNLIHSLRMQLCLYPVARVKGPATPQEQPKSKWDEQA